MLSSKYNLCLVFIFALLVRYLHNFELLTNYILYDFPLGGHSVYFDQAQRIFNGEYLPFDGAFRFNSPAYPYFLALFYKFFGFENFLALKLFTALLDSITCSLIYLLAKRSFNQSSAVWATLLYATCGPIIFYSVEFTPIPIILFLIVASFYFINSLNIFAGVLLGLAIIFRPNLIFCLLMTPLVFAFKPKQLLSGFLFHLAVCLVILPITLINYAQTNQFILLTSSAGHNFYIGHNQDARAGFYVPKEMNGDMFLIYKQAAEKETQKGLNDAEVSSYYFKKGLQHIITDPFKEAKLFLERAKLFFSEYELGNYANYYFVKEHSKFLKYLPDVKIISLFFILFILFYFRRVNNYQLLIPIIASFLSVIAFFYISRLRIVAIPFMVIFSGVAIDNFYQDIKSKARIKTLIAVLVLGLAYYFMVDNRTAQISYSNELRKVEFVKNKLK